MKICLIVAAATNNVIGRGGELPWHISDDLKRFKRLTTGKPIIMGRKTFESIGKPLPGRRNIVISRQKGLEFDCCEIVATPEAAIELVGDADEVMVIGGGRIYEQMLPTAARIYLTQVNMDVEGDTYFPELDDNEWRLVEKQDHPSDDPLSPGFSFITLNRIQPLFQNGHI